MLFLDWLIEPLSQISATSDRVAFSSRSPSEMVKHEGDRLSINLPYYQIACSIGITYEECVRLFKKLKGILIYQRGGKIIVQDWKKLESVSATEK